jgi:hypothetical protein
VSARPSKRKRLFHRSALLAIVFAAFSVGVQGAGVTIITHGFTGNVTDWIIPMAERIPGYPSFSGATISCYQISITRNGSGQYVAAATFLGGAAPLVTDSGEILVKLDWSTLSGLGGASSTTVANAAVNALLSTTLIPELGGRPLAELPLHLIGHSRGGSVITEMARFLGAQGVWVDQVTTLDPRPVAQFGDAGVTTYTNVLFADNYWQTLGDGLFVPNGQSVFGAYNRKLTSLDGGYSSSHSDVHLWYHGTIDLATPATDTQATIGGSQRSAWWSSLEMAGATAGFRYSRLGGGDRLSSLEPNGAGNGRISDGFNKYWDLGGGLAANRTPLPTNSGLWPNAIRLARTASGSIPAGSPFSLTFAHQSGASAAGSSGVRIFLDNDTNPYNGNETVIDERLLPDTGTSAVQISTLTATANAASVPPGSYAIGARITDGVRARYLYAFDSVVIAPSQQAPAIDAATLSRATDGSVHFNVLGFSGQKVAILATTDFAEWTPIATHTFSGPSWFFLDASAGDFTQRFYKAVLVP